MSSAALLRCVLSPLTSWQALKLMRRAQNEDAGALSFDVAWRRARVRRHPDETPPLLHGHRAPTTDGDHYVAPAEDRPRPDRS